MMSFFLAHVFQCLFTLCSFPLRTDWWKYDTSVDEEPQGNWRRNSNSRDVVASFSSFTRPSARTPRELARRLPGVRLYIQGLGERVGEKVWAYFAGCFHFTLYPIIIGRPNTDGAGQVNCINFWVWAYVLLEPWTLELIQDAGAGSGFSTEGSHRTPFQLRLNELALILPRGDWDSHMKQTGMLVRNFEFNP